MSSLKNEHCVSGETWYMAYQVLVLCSFFHLKNNASKLNKQKGTVLCCAVLVAITMLKWRFGMVQIVLVVYWCAVGSVTPSFSCGTPVLWLFLVTWTGRASTWCVRTWRETIRSSSSETMCSP